MKASLSNKKKNICGKQIRIIRTGKYINNNEKISQDLLAARLQVAGLDIDRTAISRVETGKRMLKDSEIFTFARVLKVPVGTLFEAVPEDEEL